MTLTRSEFWTLEFWTLDSWTLDSWTTDYTDRYRSARMFLEAVRVGTGFKVLCHCEKFLEAMAPPDEHPLNGRTWQLVDFADRQSSFHSRILSDLF